MATATTTASTADRIKLMTHYIGLNGWLSASYFTPNGYPSENAANAAMRTDGHIVPDMMDNRPVYRLTEAGRAWYIEQLTANPPAADAAPCDRWNHARLILAAQRIILDLDTSQNTPGDAWTNAVDYFRTNRIGSASAPGGTWTTEGILEREGGAPSPYLRATLWIGHPHTDLTVGHAINEALRLAGFHTEWNGSDDDNIQVYLIDPALIVDLRRHGRRTWGVVVSVSPKMVTFRVRCNDGTVESVSKWDIAPRDGVTFEQIHALRPER